MVRQDNFAGAQDWRPSVAGNSRRGRLEGGGGFFGHKPLDLAALNLTEGQKQRIQELRGQNGSKVREMRKTLQQKRSELRDLMFSAGASDEQIRAKRLEIRQMQDKFEELQLSDFLAIRSVLTAEQKQRLATLKPGVENQADRSGRANLPQAVTKKPHLRQVAITSNGKYRRSKAGGGEQMIG